MNIPSFVTHLIELLVEQYGLKDTNIAIANFTGLPRSTVCYLKSNKLKSLLHFPAQIFLLYLCAGEQYENNLYGFLTNDPSVKEQYMDLIENIDPPFTERDINRISQITYDRSTCGYYNTFKTNALRLLDSQDHDLSDKYFTDINKCINTLKKKFPSISGSANYSSENNTPPSMTARKELLQLFQYFDDDFCFSPTIGTLKEFEEKINTYLDEKRDNVEQNSDSISLDTVKNIIFNLRNFVSQTVEDYTNYTIEYTTLTNTLHLPLTDTISEFYHESDDYQKAVHYFYLEQYALAIKYFEIAAKATLDQNLDFNNFPKLESEKKALVILGYWYLIGGLGVEQNIDCAIEKLSNALRNIPCSYAIVFTDYQLVSALLLGNIYFDGKVIKIDRKEAFKFYEKPFENILSRTGHSEDAICNIVQAYSDNILGKDLYCRYAICLLCGYGTKPNVETAERIFRGLYENEPSDYYPNKKNLYFYYLCICQHKLEYINSNEFCSHLIGLIKDDCNFAKNALARLLFENETIECSAIDNLKENIDSPSQDIVNFKLLERRYTPNKCLAIKLWLDVATSSEENADLAYYNLFINEIPSPSDDFYLEAYRLKGVVFSFINEYRHNVASSILYNLGETYYDETNLENEVSKHYNFDSDFWSYSRKDDNRSCSLFWADEPSIGNLFIILNSFSKYCEFTVIVADTDGIYEKMKQVLTEKECERTFVLTNLKEWTTYYNGEHVDKKRKLQQCCNNLKLQYTEPRWIDKNHDRMGSL